MAYGELARTQIDCSEVLDIDCAVSGQSRPHEQRDVVAPRDKRLLEEFQFLPPERHEGSKCVRLLAAEREPALYVDAAEKERGVDAMMDVARVNIGLARHPGFRDQIRIARRINHYLAKTACRPSLLSKIAPLTTPFSTMGAAHHACSRSRTSTSRSIRRESVLSASGSIVGAQVTMP